MAETEEERKRRHGNMEGVRVTLPSGQVLETDSEGRPKGFVVPLEREAGEAGRRGSS